MVGLNAENGRKLILTLIIIVVLFGARRLLHGLASWLFTRERLRRVRFWVRQIVDVLVALALVASLTSLWFDNPERLTAAAGMVTAGLAFALQKVVTAVAGYVVLVRGRVFTVGDRIVMGGVRGDVIDLTFTQTRIMEMGQPPPVQNADPAMWVHSRQFTGRIVSVSNARIFDEPVYNYTREFPYIWEEMRFGIGYKADCARAEQILLDIADRHTRAYQDMSQEQRDELMRRYMLDTPAVRPTVYYRITDNWLELTVRFVAPEHGVRALKDKMSRDILPAFNEAGLEIASTTFEVVGLPKLRLELPAAR